MSSILSRLDATNSIKNAMPQIINAFVELYGEADREFITNQLTNIVLVGYYDSETLSRLIYSAEEEITKDIVSDIFKTLGIEDNEENYNKYMGKTSNFRYVYGIPIIEIFNYIKMYKKGMETLIHEEQQINHSIISRYVPNLSFDDFVNNRLTEEQINRVPQYYRSAFGIDYTAAIQKKLNREKSRAMEYINLFEPTATVENVDEMIDTGKLDYLIEGGKIFEEGIHRYEETVEKSLKGYKDYLERVNEYQKKAKEKYLLQLLIDLKVFLNAEDQLELDELISTESFDSLKLRNAQDVITGCLLYPSKAIDSFSENSSKELIDPNTWDYRIETIKKNRIKYFKYKGIDLGDNYDDYANNPECLAIWPKKEDIDLINERAEYYLNEYNIDICTNNGFYLEAQKEAAEKGLLDKESLLNPRCMIQKTTCVFPNVRKANEGHSLYPMVAIYADSGEHSDARIMHELNHVIELALQEIHDGKYTCVCGWDICEGTYGQEAAEMEDTISKDRTKRNYELFSEIVNELLGQKAVSILHNNNAFVLSDKDNYKNDGATSYELTKFLVQDFFEKYFDDIVASRRNNNIEVIWNRVGKENFDSLNELFHRFYEEFPEFKFYSVCKQLQEKQDTEEVRRLKALVADRNQILANMAEYSKQSQL